MSQTHYIAVKTLFKAFEILARNNNELQGKEVIKQIENELEFSDWEKARYEKTGYVRWQSILHFYTIDDIKAGYLYKNAGIWYLTEEGRKAIELGPEGMFKSANEGYKKWKLNQIATEAKDTDTNLENLRMKCAIP